MFANSPSGRFRGQTDVVAEGPVGFWGRRYQKPKCVPPAAAFRLTMLFGLTIQNVAGVMSTFRRLLDARTNIPRLS